MDSGLAAAGTLGLLPEVFKIGAGVVIVALALTFFVLWVRNWRRGRRLVHGGGLKSEYTRARRGRGLPVAELARRLDMEVEELVACRPHYRRVTIPKRRGGYRTLYVPDDETKGIQRRILHRVLARLRAHHASCGFERGRSIVDNARAHLGSAVVVRVDVVDFFSNTRSDRIEHYFRRIGWDREAAEILTAMTTHEDGLPQGAPTSPRLSNLVNFYVDVQIENKVRRYKGRYTRYADDITVSFPEDYPRHVRGIVQSVRKILRSKGYELHERTKFSIRRRHQQQRVTGLVVNDSVNLPRATRRWLRAVEHRLKTRGEATLTEEQLRGWSGVVAMVERARVFEKRQDAT